MKTGQLTEEMRILPHFQTHFVNNPYHKNPITSYGVAGRKSFHQAFLLSDYQCLCFLNIMTGLLEIYLSFQLYLVFGAYIWYE